MQGGQRSTSTLEAHSIGQFLRGIGYEDFLND